MKFYPKKFLLATTAITLITYGAYRLWHQDNIQDIFDNVTSTAGDFISQPTPSMRLPSQQYLSSLQEINDGGYMPRSNYLEQVIVESYQSLPDSTQQRISRDLLLHTFAAIPEQERPNYASELNNLTETEGVELPSWIRSTYGKLQSVYQSVVE